MPKIKTVYVIHHSHTDIGYTDLQERVIDTQADYIRTVLDIMAKPENTEFRWNCETLFCVEEFFKSAAPEQQEAFCRRRERSASPQVISISPTCWTARCMPSGWPGGRPASRPAARL